jgi:hypothetical protein
MRNTRRASLVLGFCATHAPQVEPKPPNRPALCKALGAVAFTMISTTAPAQEYYRQKIQWGDPLAPSHTRTRCVKNASTSGFRCSGPKCFHTKTTCIGWATDTQTMQCELIMRVPRPNSLPADVEAPARYVAEACAGVALASVGAESFASAGAAIAALEPVFRACVETRGGEGLVTLSIAVDRSCGWNKWSNE